MSISIKDAQSGLTASVSSNNRLTTQAATFTEGLSETVNGNGYNVNTGEFTLTSVADHGVMYFKNNTDNDIIIGALAAGVDRTGATITGKTRLKVWHNPTSVDFSTAVDMNANRNLSTNKDLGTSLAYKGTEGDAVTGGEQSLLFFQGDGRLFATIDLVVGPGNDIAVTMDPKVSAGNCVAYVALIMYKKTEF